MQDNRHKQLKMTCIILETALIVCRMRVEMTINAAKFEFVGINSNGVITIYHVESGKAFWKKSNGKSIQGIYPMK